MRTGRITQGRLNGIIGSIMEHPNMARESQDTIHKVCHLLVRMLHLDVLPDEHYDLPEHRVLQGTTAAEDSGSPAPSEVVIETNTGETNWRQRLKLGDRIVLHVYDKGEFYFAGKNKRFTTADLLRLLPQLHALAECHKLDDGTQPLVYVMKKVKTRTRKTVLILANAINCGQPLLGIIDGNASELLRFNSDGRYCLSGRSPYDLILCPQDYEPLTIEELFKLADRCVKRAEPISGHDDPDLYDLVGAQKFDGVWRAGLLSTTGANYWETPGALLDKYVWFDSTRNDDMTPVGKLVTRPAN